MLTLSLSILLEVRSDAHQCRGTARAAHQADSGSSTVFALAGYSNIDALKSPCRDVASAALTVLRSLDRLWRRQLRLRVPRALHRTSTSAGLSAAESPPDRHVRPPQSSPLHIPKHGLDATGCRSYVASGRSFVFRLRSPVSLLPYRPLEPAVKGQARPRRHVHLPLRGLRGSATLRGCAERLSTLPERALSPSPTYADSRTGSFRRLTRSQSAEVFPIAQREAGMAAAVATCLGWVRHRSGFRDSR